MQETKKDKIEAFIAILLGVFAIFAIMSIFENDNSKIVSKKGRKILSDSDKMDDLDKKVKENEESKSDESHKEIYI